MRHPLPFDTHAYIKKLVAAGMPEPQAEVQAEALAEIVLSHLATKEDLSHLAPKEDLRLAKEELQRSIDQLRADMDRLRAEFKAEIDHLRTELKADIREAELRLSAKLEAELRKQMVWFFGMLVVLTGALVALLRVLPPPS
jgi:DNA gyrase/topoisomerase IV subunit A